MAFESGSVWLPEGLAAPLTAAPAALRARPFMLGVKVGLEVVPPI